MDSQLGSRIKQLRLKAGLTQVELAKTLDVSSALISAYELGERKPSLEILVELAGQFGVSTDYLLGIDRAIPAGRMDGLSLEEVQAVETLIGLFRVKQHG